MADYIKEKDLVDIINRYRKNPKKADEFVAAISLLAENLLRKMYFKGFATCKDDFIQEAILVCLQRQHCFKESKGKCFTYMTTIVLNHWRHIWNIDKRQRFAVEKYIEMVKFRGDNL